MRDDGHISAAGGRYAGLERYAARQRILADLEAAGDLVGSRPHEMIIGRCQRSHDVVEPRLKTQWFVRTKPLAEAALQATRTKRTILLPERFEKVWEHWLTEIRDWNVSRQLWWGHRIPAWYCPDGHVTVSPASEGPGACEACGRPAAELTQDPDILDTWFSSGLWPFSTLGWPDETPDLARFYPGTVMETAYDIIFFWVARMMMLGIHLWGDPSWSPLRPRARPTAEDVEDEGQRGRPARGDRRVGRRRPPLRPHPRRGAGQRPEVQRGEARERPQLREQAWNAARFSSVPARRPSAMPRCDAWTGPRPGGRRPRAAWRPPSGRRPRPADYAFGQLTATLYDAIWGEYCDWALELAKVRLADEAAPAADREATWWTLVEALDTYLRLLHPVMPFLTEAIWGQLPRAQDDPPLLMVADWPAAGRMDGAADAETGALLDLVRAIRNARAEARVEPGAWLPVDVAVPAAAAPTFDALRPALERLARARPLVRVADPRALHADPRGGLAVVAGDLEAVVRPAAVEAGTAARDRLRLEKELAGAEAQLAATRARLADARFAARAPAAVVEGARARESELAERAAKLRARLARRGGAA
jgi:valyl-tRNA synthetase